MFVASQWVAGLLCAAVLAAVPGSGQKAPQWEVVADFVEAIAGEGVENPAGASATSDSIGGVTKPAIFQHPSATGKPLVHITFRGIALPNVRGAEKLALTFSIGIREGFPKTEMPEADGCAFIVRVGDEEVYRAEHEQQQWHDVRVDLTRLAGQTVSVTFAMDPLKNSACDWAVWGAPRIVVEGRPAKPKPIPPVPFLKLSELSAKPVPSRIVSVHQDTRNTVVTAVLDRDLDLATAVADEAKRSGAGPAPLGPSLVVGEGAHPANHTLVRVLTPQGIAEAQFLAFGPEVRGGVSVNCGDLGGGACIAASPIADAKVREIRLFNRHGDLVRVLTPDARIAPPYAVAVGRFIPSRAEAAIAVTSAAPQPADAFVAIYSGAGRLQRRIPLPNAFGDTATLSRADGNGADRLLVSLPKAGRALAFDVTSGAMTERKVPGLEAGKAAYASAFGDQALLVPKPDATRSVVTRVPREGDTAEMDLGGSESRFWIQWYGKDWPTLPDGKYVRKSVAHHLRTDGASPAARNPRIATDQEKTAGASFVKGFADVLDSYDRDLPALWEPCFTHRWHKGVFQPWRDTIDPETKLQKYVMLSRNNHPIEYGEFGNIEFYSGSYAFGMPELDNLYLWPLRAFLRALVVKFRANPEHFVALEPNHEHEIAVDADASLGDYNPRMIEGFYAYLRARYGGDAAIRKAMGTPHAAYFDAPRNWDRGDWDSYSKDNPLFREWTAYQRYIVSRRAAETYREALLAGFPAEAVKSHQIPDTYAIGKLSAFSTITSRFTPIDWHLNCGAGYGFTRYGVWYNQPHDALQDAHAAGFDAMVMGEYQALTPSEADAYNQLRFIQQNGGLSVHCMMWPAEFDKGFNATMDAAATRLMRDDPPRPAQIGGVGEVRAYRDGIRAFDIACIGTGGEHTGLLKSLTADGKWEGTVYATPFHAHVDVKPLQVARTRGRAVVGPLDGLDSGVQIELVVRARGEAGGTLRFAVKRGDAELPGLAQVVRTTAGEKPYRFVLRAQLPTDGLHIVVAAQSASIVSAQATRQAELTPKLPKGILTGERHRGGVTFDVLPNR